VLEVVDGLFKANLVDGSRKLALHKILSLPSIHNSVRLDKMMGLDYKVYTHVSGIRKTVHLTGVLFFVAQQPNSGLGRLNIEVSRSRTITQTFTPGTTPLNE
jgi:hypothetical protein